MARGRKAPIKTAAKKVASGRIGKPKTKVSGNKKVTSGRVSKTKTKASSRKKAATKSSSSKAAPKKAAKGKTESNYRRNCDGTPAEYYGTLQLNEPHIINKYLEIRTTPTKGRGVFTRVANIPAGTLLLQERVLLDNPDYDKYKNSKFRILVSRLKPYDQQKFIALSHHGLPDNEESRMIRNCFGTEDSTFVWFWISMINHDCKPSCQWLIHGEGEARFGSLRSMVPIPEKGTEITIDYLQRDEPSKQTVEGRAALMTSSWGFACDCASCADPATTNADFAELQRLRTLVKLSSEKPSVTQRKTVEGNLNRLVELLLEFRFIDQVFDKAYEAMNFYTKFNDDLARDLAVRWALEAVRVGAIGLGSDQIEYAHDTGAVEGTSKKKAPEPRFLDTHTGYRAEYLELVDTTLPALIRRKYYGNLQPLQGRPDVSDISRFLYK